MVSVHINSNFVPELDKSLSIIKYYKFLIRQTEARVVAIFILLIYYDIKHRKKRPTGHRIMTVTDIAKCLQNPWCPFQNSICEASKMKKEQERKEGEEGKGKQKKFMNFLRTKNVT